MDTNDRDSRTPKNKTNIVRLNPLELIVTNSEIHAQKVPSNGTSMYSALGQHRELSD